LAERLLEIARHLNPELVRESTDVLVGDTQLERLRTLLVGQEIDVLSRLTNEVEDPEQLATAIGRILPTAIAHASSDARLGQVLAPAFEKATESSIRSNPRTLVNILYPLIVPAIRKSIGESIDETFQSLNESLKYSLTWRGLRWRWEAWRSGQSFAEIVLKHTLVYQVEHVFLIHGHTGLLISHVAAENAASQDPQIVSSMLGAIQDFVKDSFSGAEQHGLDALRLGELRLWSEQGPFATLVAVIRGNPPEALHDTLRNVLSRIHAERPHALESFNGDSSGFADIEAELSECVALGQQASPTVKPSFPLLVPVAVATLLIVVAVLGLRWWEDARRWEDFVAQLREQPGIVITDVGQRDGKYTLSGLRDPLAVDPQPMMREAGIDPARVETSWAPYEALDPAFMLRRLKASLDPPPTVTLALEGDRVVAQGSAPALWLDRAHAADRMLPAGTLRLDLSAVRNADADDEKLWEGYIRRLQAQPGIVITESGRRDGRFEVAGLRDPLAVDPQFLMREAGIDPARVDARFARYQGLDPAFVLARLKASLNPPQTVTLAVEGDHIVAHGSAPAHWLERAHTVGWMLPAGAAALDLSKVKNADDEAFAKLVVEVSQLREAIQSNNIHFAYGVPLPAPGQDAILDQVAKELNELASASSGVSHVSTKVMVTGHSDALGEGTFNLALSEARAEAVRALLKKRGVDPDLLAVRGAGPLEPLEAGNSAAIRAINRRVTFTVEIEERP
jgi:outer membrane protein OmpA-like peptidoglycan-associated protein